MQQPPAARARLGRGRLQSARAGRAHDPRATDVAHATRVLRARSRPACVHRARQARAVPDHRLERVRRARHARPRLPCVPSSAHTRCRTRRRPLSQRARVALCRARGGRVHARRTRFALRLALLPVEVARRARLTHVAGLERAPLTDITHISSNPRHKASCACFALRLALLPVEEARRARLTHVAGLERAPLTDITHISSNPRHKASCACFALRLALLPVEEARRARLTRLRASACLELPLLALRARLPVGPRVSTSADTLRGPGPRHRTLATGGAERAVQRASCGAGRALHTADVPQHRIKHCVSLINCFCNIERLVARKLLGIVCVRVVRPLSKSGEVLHFIDRKCWSKVKTCAMKIKLNYLCVVPWPLSTQIGTNFHRRPEEIFHQDSIMTQHLHTAIN